MSYQQLTTKERFLIELLLLMGFGFREIGRQLGRAHTTISREIGRNHRGDVYCSLNAEEMASSRRILPRHHRRQTHQPLVEYAGDKLALDWSPEQIANTLPHYWFSYLCTIKTHLRRQNVIHTCR